MKNWVRLGCWVLSAGMVACGVACGGSRMVRPDAPTSADETPAVAVSSGGGGAGSVDPGRFPPENERSEPRGAQRELYSQVARELKLKHEASWGRQEGTGGSGISAREKSVCAEVINSPERAKVVSGIITFRSRGLVTVDIPGQGPVKLNTDEITCTVQAGKALLPESLSEGTEARVAYVEEPSGPTARVIRAEPMRPQR